MFMDPMELDTRVSMPTTITLLLELMLSMLAVAITVKLATGQPFIGLLHLRMEESFLTLELSQVADQKLLPSVPPKFSNAGISVCKS